MNRQCRPSSLLPLGQWWRQWWRQLINEEKHTNWFSNRRVVRTRKDVGLAARDGDEIRMTDYSDVSGIVLVLALKVLHSGNALVPEELE